MSIGRQWHKWTERGKRRFQKKDATGSASFKVNSNYREAHVEEVNVKTMIAKKEKGKRNETNKQN